MMKPLHSPQSFYNIVHKLLELHSHNLVFIAHQQRASMQMDSWYGLSICWSVCLAICLAIMLWYCVYISNFFTHLVGTSF